jgi:hypothetical protein
MAEAVLRRTTLIPGRFSEIILQICKCPSHLSIILTHTILNFKLKTQNFKLKTLPYFNHLSIRIPYTIN